MSEIPKSITEHPVWAKIQPWVTIERRDTRPNIEVKFDLPENPMPLSLREEVLAATLACAACGQPMNAFRVRKAQSDRMELPRYVYFSATCPTTLSLGCTRTKAARDEHRNVVEDHEEKRAA